MKTLEENDVKNNKLLLEISKILKEILLKDEFIRYLIETQTTVLDVVTSVKNQEKTHEKIQKTNVPQQRQQQNLQRQHIQQHFLCEHNI